MPFPHVAKYQGRIVADAILGPAPGGRLRRHPARSVRRPGDRRHRADPSPSRPGRPADRGRADRPRGHPRAAVDLRSDPRGQLRLLADADRRVLIGAWAVAPQAGEWIHQASLAIRAQIPIDTLLDQVAQFPTYTEGYLTALENLPL
ncbi:hypothetical protein [Cellulomonas sp. ATA003]|uniref:hypothetical protein n=1 Tax=Cellulomonas sp. ATA003 TaxID=3073064 RepID=UPI002872DC31|nr:hypothetical protein [Cellulomonas sp. ATA003]WNB87541.1 hypothetical protein REH70_13445 [Cellulomonas sp. ATA003]